MDFLEDSILMNRGFQVYLFGKVEARAQLAFILHCILWLGSWLPLSWRLFLCLDDLLLLDFADLVLALMSIARAKGYLKGSLFKVFILSLFVVLPKQVMSFGYN